MRRFSWLLGRKQVPRTEERPAWPGVFGPRDDIDLAERDPGLTYDARFLWVIQSTSADVALVPDLPNPMARKYAIEAAALDIEDWEFVVTLSRRTRASALHLQHAIWSGLFPEAQVKALDAVWMGAQSAFTLVLLGMCFRNEERSASHGEKETFERWAAFQEWLSGGGAGIISQGAGHLATRPYSSARTLEAAMSPVEEVLPFARYGDMRRQGLAD